MPKNEEKDAQRNIWQHGYGEKHVGRKISYIPATSQEIMLGSSKLKDLRNQIKKNKDEMVLQRTLLL